MTKPQQKDQAQGDNEPDMTITVVEISATHPQGFGGHEFEYEAINDLFKCWKCGAYEVVVRDGKTGVISQCPVVPLFENAE